MMANLETLLHAKAIALDEMKATLERAQAAIGPTNKRLPFVREYLDSELQSAMRVCSDIVDDLFYEDILEAKQNEK